MVEPLINYFTLEHLLFGIGTAIIISILSRRNDRVFLISFYIILLWELFEFRQWPHYWIDNYLNEIMDIIVGGVGIFLGFRIVKKFQKRRI
jgi:hypothetical protein